MPHTGVGARRARSHMVVYFTAVPFDLKKKRRLFFYMIEIFNTVLEMPENGI
jgi:hypothetical protein